MEAVDRQAATRTRLSPEEAAAQAEQLARRVVDLVADKKASDIVILDIRQVSSLADYFVICTGESERQIKAISDGLIEALRKEGLRPLHSEGTSASGWVLLDYGDVVAHVFSPDTRGYYRVEKVWEGAAVVLHMQ
jgi:ribosome-associated protein